MNRLIDNTRLALLCLFLVACAGMAVYQAYYIWPMQKCERAGAWWSPKYRECDAPIPIWRITGRPAKAAETPPHP